MRARIYQPAKSAMQSGRANTRQWVLEYEPARPRSHDRLMGWTGSADTNRQVKLHFASKDSAVAFARKHGIDFELEEPHPRRIRPKSYAANFRWEQVR